MFEGGRLVAVGTSINGLPVEVSMPADAKLWSPDEPFLYQMEVSLFEGGKRVDCVRSYMAMRKYSVSIWSVRSGLVAGWIIYSSYG